MSKATLKRHFCVLPQEPQADFEWPPNSREQAPEVQLPDITETEQHVQWCFKERPTDEEPARFAFETVDPGLKESCADLTWPPSPEELAQCRIIEVVNAGAVSNRPDVETGEPLLKPGVPAPLATSWVSTQLPTVVTDATYPGPSDSGYRDRGFNEPCADFTWPPSPEELARYRVIDTESSELLDPERDSSLAETVPTPSDADHPLYTCIDDSTPSGYALAHSDPSLEGKADWAAEIARLQQLIEALTEKFDWRITNVVHT
jgi:hypothetical protein